MKIIDIFANRKNGQPVAVYQTEGDKGLFCIDINGKTFYFHSLEAAYAYAMGRGVIFNMNQYRKGKGRYKRGEYIVDTEAYTPPEKNEVIE